MFAITFMSTALLDEVLFWMRCRQLWREAKEAAERLMKVLEDKIRISPMCMNEQIRKNNSSTKEENQSKKMGTREV